MTTTMTITTQELATVLAALRYWQQEMEAEKRDGNDWVEDMAGAGHFESETPLTADCIDGLCERLNAGTPMGSDVPERSSCVIGVSS